MKVVAARRRSAPGLALLLVVAGLAACGGGRATGDVDAQLRSARELWDGRSLALSTADATRLASVEGDRALVGDRAYFIDYLHPAGIPVSEPQVLEPPRLVASTAGSFVAAVKARWSLFGRQRTVWTLFRVDWRHGDFRITAVFDRVEGEFPLLGGLAPLHALSAPESKLVRAAGDFDGYVTGDSGLRPDFPFAQNDVTARVLGGIATHKAPEPWELDTTTSKLATTADGPGFSVSIKGAVLACGIVDESTLVRHRDGVPIRPEPVLGDAHVFVRDGLYKSFTETGVEKVCVRSSAGGKPEIVALTRDRTGVSGVPAP
ncbi:MAG TPA: hypothetical protein VFJ85_06300 [Acidimicrobiales bacterium]|nr:hypothetical protein [Acidimicrobiales bacterium]